VIATVGRSTLSGTGGTQVAVIDVIQRQDVDFAIAKLAVPVRGVKPLAISRRPPTVGEVIRMTGCGSTDGKKDLSHRSDRAQTGQWRITGVTPTLVRARGFAPLPTTSACPFDSGAPYFSEETPAQPRLVATEITGQTCPHSQDETTA